MLLFSQRGCYHKSLRLNEVYALNDHVGRAGLFRQIGPFLTIPRSSFSRVWNAIHDHDFDPIKEKSGTNNRDVMSFHVDFIGKFDLVSKVS